MSLSGSTGTARAHLLQRLTFFEDPVPDPRSQTICGGVLTVLVMPVMFFYIVWVVLEWVTAPMDLNFEGLSSTTQLNPPLSGVFTCKCPEGCTVCVLPCLHGGGRKYLDFAGTADVHFPFFALQRTHYFDTESSRLVIGLPERLESSAILIGTVQGDNSRRHSEVEVTIQPSAMGAGAMLSCKLRATRTRLADGELITEVVADGEGEESAECPAPQRAICFRELGSGTFSANNPVYPLSLQDVGGYSQTSVFCQTVCADSVSLLLRERRYGPGPVAVVGEIGGFFSLLVIAFAALNRAAWRCCAYSTLAPPDSSDDECGHARPMQLVATRS